MSDTRWGTLTGHTRNIVKNAHVITETLCDLHVMSDVDVRKGEKVGRNTAVSRPVEGQAVEVEDAARSMGSKFVLLLAGRLPVEGGADVAYEARADRTGVWGLAEIAQALTGDSGASPGQLATLVDEVEGGMPLVRGGAWRRSVSSVCDLWTQTASLVEDGWGQMYRDRRVCETCREPQCRLGCAGGSLVEDEGVDADLTSYLGMVRQVEAKLFGLRQRVAPTPLTVCSEGGCRRPASEDGLCGVCAQGRCRAGCGRLVSGTCGACRKRASRARGAA